MDNVVLLSGGMDSAVMLSTACELGACVALIFDYGQSNRAELDAAKRLAEHYEVSQRVVELDMSFAQGGCAALGGDDISHTFVPARNLLFLSYGISMAEATGAHSVWFGANQDDHEYYPDTRPVFARVMSLAAEVGTQHGGIEIISPFMKMTKREVAELGQRKLVPLSWTTTCAIGDPPCGKCRGCKQRAEAMGEKPSVVVSVEPRLNKGYWLVLLDGHPYLASPTGEQAYGAAEEQAERRGGVVIVEDWVRNTGDKSPSASLDFAAFLERKGV